MVREPEKERDEGKAGEKPWLTWGMTCRRRGTLWSWHVGYSRVFPFSVCTKGAFAWLWLSGTGSTPPSPACMGY